MEVGMVERQILDDVYRLTSLRYPRLAIVDVGSGSVGRNRDVLNLLAAWVDRLPEQPNIRGAIYMKFGVSPLQREYLSSYLAWLRTESDELNLGSLMRLTAVSTTNKRAHDVWLIVKNRTAPSRCKVLAKLVKSSELRDEVVMTILAQLNSGQYDSEDLSTYIQINDATVRQWFRDHLSDPRVAKYAKRVNNKNKKPVEVRAAGSTPHDTDEVELASAHLDLVDLQRYIRAKVDLLGIEESRTDLDFSFLEETSETQWYVLHLGILRGRPVKCWLKAEDTDAVDVVLTTNS